MDRENALQFLKENIANPNLIKHCLATEAIMRKLALHFDEDADLWGLTGLLHDVDLGEVGDDMSRHADVGADWCAERGLPEVACRAIRTHNDALGLGRESTFEHALAAAETITGLIVATSLVYPDKKVASVKPKSVRKRMKEKNFAAGVNRDIIMECEQIGFELGDFIVLSLDAMCEIAEELGL
jgi:uncharacterized protein